MSDMQRAIDSYQTDARFRAIAQSIVARVLQNHGPVDPECADQDAHDIALDVAVLLLQRIYEDDAELLALRTERDMAREAVKKLSILMPPQPIIVSAP